jgi:hypothetical protein
MARPWDFSRFSRGEPFVYQPMARSKFDEALQQVERWASTTIPRGARSRS